MTTEGVWTESKLKRRLQVACNPIAASNATLDELREPKAGVFLFLFFSVPILLILLGVSYRPEDASPWYVTIPTTVVVGGTVAFVVDRSRKRARYLRILKQQSAMHRTIDCLMDTMSDAAKDAAAEAFLRGSERGDVFFCYFPDRDATDSVLSDTAMFGGFQEEGGFEAHSKMRFPHMDAWDRVESRLKAALDRDIRSRFKVVPDS